MRSRGKHFSLLVLVAASACVEIPRVRDPATNGPEAAADTPVTDAVAADVAPDSPIATGCNPSCHSRQVCDESSGTPRCVCGVPYTGADCQSCSAGYQDNDDNGTCLPDCTTAGLTCVNGTCADETGTARCECQAGSEDDGQGGCTPVVESLTFILSECCEGNDLDNGDAGIFGNCMASLGYKQDTHDRSTTKAKLNEYLQRSDVTVVWHTSHGSPSSIELKDGDLAISKITGINVRDSMYMTCETMQSTEWTKVMGPSAIMVAGYTKDSWDDEENRVAKAYCKQIQAGRTNLQAWYLANKPESYASKGWLAYYRQGGQPGAPIIEYSARSTNVPTVPTSFAADSWIALDANERVRIPAGLLTETGRSPSTSLARFKVVGRAEHVVDLDQEAFDALTPTAMTEQQAIREAKAYLRARRELPDDAVLDRVTALQRRIPGSSSAVTIGFEVRYSRKILGLPVRGNRGEDHLSLLVGRRGVVSTSRYWPNIARVDAPETTRALGRRQAVLRAGPRIADCLKCKSRYHFVEVAPAYGTRGCGAPDRSLVPAYALRTAEGQIVVIDALSGELL